MVRTRACWSPSLSGPLVTGEMPACLGVGPPRPKKREGAETSGNSAGGEGKAKVLRQFLLPSSDEHEPAAFGLVDLLLLALSLLLAFVAVGFF